MSSITNVGNLKQSQIKPLRGTAKARPDSGQGTARSFSVEDLKNGGTMEVGGLIGSNNSAETNTIRKQYLGKGPAQSARSQQNSQLSPEERIEKLAKIRKSAVEYESVFMDQLVKQMRQSPLAKTPGSETFSDIAEQPFRGFLSQAGGLGLADTIVSQVARQEGLEETLNENPSIMGPNWRPSIPPNLMKKPGLRSVNEILPGADSVASGEPGKPLKGQPDV